MPTKSAIATPKAAPAVGPFSQGTKFGDFVFVSGQLPIDLATGQFPDGVEAQTKQSLANLKAVLEAGGASLNSILKTTVFLKDMNDFAAMNAIYAAHFTGALPARSTIEVARLPRDALVEIEAIAAVEGSAMNEHTPGSFAPPHVEAFAHPAGKSAAATPGGALAWRGTLLHIHIAEAASCEMEEVSEAVCVAGRGIVGDRYYNGSGTYSPKPDVREVTLIEQEALDALSRNDPPLQNGPITLAPIDHRRNLTTRGVPLNHLVGRRFRVGEVILRGGRLNFPCKYLEELLGLPVYLPLYNRSGLNCGIERGGTLRPGDAIELLD